MSLIGVFCRQNERESAKEFFELFKTPWEFYHNQRHYDVVLSSGEIPREKTYSVMFIYDSGKNGVDADLNIRVKSAKNRGLLEFRGTTVPIYEQFSTFEGHGTALIKMEGSHEVSGLEIKKDNLTFVRIGYDLFQEVGSLLSKGQPSRFAFSPTLEIHISMLRYWISRSRIPLIEIPPVPIGYDYITCLTHDVDFVGIRNHMFDRTMFGFIYRALIKTFVDYAKGEPSKKKLFNNWKAALLLPAVYAGIVKDFWVLFEKYVEIEKGLTSTFYFIPFKKKPGEILCEGASKKRTCKYEASNLKPYISYLISKGNEIGLHGIDAWQDMDLGRKELAILQKLSGNSEVGIRMHWLYYDEDTAITLDKTGFLYDSTLGYNDSVGFFSGTTQVFKHLGVKNLLELPLNIQDTALFYSSRMNLKASSAFEVAKSLIEEIRKYGGALTVNWHHRSIGPERYWDEFYLSLLEYIKKDRVLFLCARDAVKWFKRRRSISFKDVAIAGNRIKVKLTGEFCGEGGGLALRANNPNGQLAKDIVQNDGISYSDYPLEPNMNILIKN